MRWLPRSSPKRRSVPWRALRSRCAAVCWHELSGNRIAFIEHLDCDHRRHALVLPSVVLRPVVAVCATVIDRAFDQVLINVPLHEAGVTFVLDRAGVTSPTPRAATACESTCCCR